MPAQRHGGIGQTSFGGSTAGGGPDAAFIQNVSPATASYNTNSTPNPYANVGKFNANVMSPGAFSQSAANDVQNGGLIHGMAAGVFGPGSLLGGVPLVSGAAMGAADILDFGGSRAIDLLGGGGDVLKTIGTNFNPLAKMWTAGKWLTEPESPGKAAARAEMEKQGLNPFAILDLQSKYFADLDRKYAAEHPEDTGPFGLYGILPEARQFGVNPLGGYEGNVGGMVEAMTQPGLAIARYTARALAGSNLTAGLLRNEWTITDNAIQILAKRDPATLTKVQAEAVSKYKSGEFSNDKAIDFLMRNNAGLNDNPYANLIMESFLDPTVYGSLFGALFAKAGRVAGKIGTTLKAIDAAEEVGRTMTVAEATAKGLTHMDAEEAALSRAVILQKKSAIEPLIRGVEAKVADGTLTEAQGKLRIEVIHRSGLGMLEGFLGRTIGPYALPVMMHPIYGPIARKVHNIVDPTRILFPESSATARVAKSRLSVDATAAVTHAHGLFNTDKVYAGLERFHPELVQKVMDDIGGYTAGLSRVWAGKNLGATMLKKLRPTFGDVNQAIDTRLANLPDDFFVQLEYLAADVMPFGLTPEGVAIRMATAYGNTADTYLPFLKTLNQKGLSYLHAATTQRARSDLLSAIAKQFQAGTWTHKMGLEKLILIAPGELTNVRAEVLLRLLKRAGSDEERLSIARQAVQQYDILRKSHSLGTGTTDVDGVNKVIKHIRQLKKEDVLASEMPAGAQAKLTGEVADWLMRYGQTADGAPMYTIGFRPEDSKLWRLIRDADTGEVIDTAPWVDYVAEAAPGYRPGYGRVLPGMLQAPADWLHIAKSNLFHSVSTQRVALEAERRFIRIGMEKLGMTEEEARTVHTVLDKTAQSGEHAMRGLSAADMWKAADTVLPYRLRGKVGRRQIVDAVLEAYKGEFHIVGATQLLTGQLKQTLDKIPIMNMGGGNYIGQISEKVWPNLKFKFNPYFQFQESGEGQFFSVLKGIMPFWRGEVSAMDERAFKVWGTFDKNLEGVGDQLERSVAVVLGSAGETLEKSTGIKRIKYVNAVRQFRKTLGEQARQQWPEEFLTEMRAKYHTMDDGEMVIRYLAEQTEENARVLHDVLEMGGDNAFESVIKAAAWSKPATLGVVAPLHMDEVARLMDLKTEGELIRAVRSKKHPLTSSDVANKLSSMQANPAYIERVVNDLKFMGIENWWQRVGKAYNMKPAEVEAFRAWQRGVASAAGMSESEWISQHFSNDVMVFGDPKTLPVTKDIMLNSVRRSLEERSKVIYAHDDPEVLKMAQRTQEQYLESVPNPRKLAELQRTHDKVNADPAAYGPGATARHRHVENGYAHVTGEVDFESFAQQIEQHVGSGYDPLTGELVNATAILDATRWYRELPGMILGLVDGDVELASKIYLAWTFSQKSDSPINGFIRTLRAYDRQQFATAEGLATFMRDDLGLAREAIAAVLEGRPVTSGLGIKLWDFSGAAIGMNKRVVGHHLPAPADRWAFRGAGFMDAQGLGQFMRAYGYRTPEEAGYLDPAPYLQPVWTKEVDEYGQRIQKVDKKGDLVYRGDAKAYDEALAAENLRRSRMRKNKLPPLKRVYTSVGPAQYEYVTKWLNDMTAAANAAEWMGKTDWMPRDMQALDWIRIQKAFGAYPESGADMVHAVTSNLALSVDPMKRGVYGTNIEDWGQFTTQDRRDFTAEAAHFTAGAFRDRLGISVPAIHYGHDGVYLGEATPWMSLSVAGTNEISERAALSAMAMHQADHAVAIRDVPDFKTARVRVTKDGVETELGFRHAIDFEMGYPNAEAVSTATARLAELPTLKGATLVPHVLPDGTRAVRFVWNRISPKTGRVASTTSKQVNALIDTLAGELDDAGLTAVRMHARSVHVQEFTHDWATDPKAYEISRRLDGLGVAGRYTNRQLFGGGRFPLTGEEAYRGATPGEHAGLLGGEGGAIGEGGLPGSVSPLVGEARAYRDGLVAEYLRNPVRGRANPDGTYIADLGTVNEGVHGFAVAPPLPLSEADQRLVQVLRDEGDDYGADNLRKVLQGYMGEPRPEPVLRIVTPKAAIEQMRQRMPGAYLETPEAHAGHVSLVPTKNMMRAAGMRPSMFAYAADPGSIEASQVLAKQHFLMTRGFDKPIVLDYSIADDAVRFSSKDDRQWLEAADLADLNYMPATVIVHDRFPLTPEWGNWEGENIFAQMDEEDLTRLGDLLDQGGVISPERLGMAVDKGFGEGFVSETWQATHELSQAMTGHAATITKTPGYPTRGEAFLSDAAQHQVERFLEGIYDAPGGRVPLYSGQRLIPGHARYSNPEVGDVVTMPLKATSPNPEMAHRFAWGTNWESADKPGFVFAFPEGTRGIVQDERAEIVVSGKFRVTRVRQMDPWEWLGGTSQRPGHVVGFGGDRRMDTPITVADVEPVEIFNPHSKQWEPYHRTQPLEPDTSGMTFYSQNDEVVRGASKVGADGRVTLWASKDSATPLVFAHEMAHAMHVHLAPSMQARIIKNFNAENGRRLTRWNRDVSEWFADSFIRYLREGSVHADPEMNRAFRFFSKWADRSIKKGLLKGEEKGLAARGALSAEEAARLQVPLKEGHRAILDEITAGPKAEATHFNATEEAVWTAATDAVRAAGYDAFRVNFFKRNRTLLERSLNHPMFGLYPASYMWGKVMPEMIRFIAKDPFGLPGGHVAWLSNDIWRSIQQQSELDPDFAKQMEAIGKNGAIRFISLSLPATPWEHAVNAPAWTRRLAQAGLENEALAKKGLKPKNIDYPGIFKDTMQYQFGAIPNTFDAATKGASGLEDIYALMQGEPTTGKNAPSIGKGLETITANINALGGEIGKNLPSINDVFSPGDSNIQVEDLTSQSEQLQTELNDAQMQLQTIFARYPFTQQ